MYTALHINTVHDIISAVERSNSSHGIFTSNSKMRKRARYLSSEAHTLLSMLRLRAEMSDEAKAEYEHIYSRCQRAAYHTNARVHLEAAQDFWSFALSQARDTSHGLLTQTGSAPRSVRFDTARDPRRAHAPALPPRAAAQQHTAPAPPPRISSAQPDTRQRARATASAIPPPHAWSSGPPPRGACTVPEPRAGARPPPSTPGAHRRNRQGDGRPPLLPSGSHHAHAGIPLPVVWLPPLPPPPPFPPGPFAMPVHTMFLAGPPVGAPGWAVPPVMQSW